MNLKNNRGAITVFIIASCLLFIITAIGIATYVQNKVNNSEGQYKQIKSIYEKEIGNEKAIYESLNGMKKNISNNFSVNFDNKNVYVLPTGQSEVTISQRFSVETNKSQNINSIKYIWLEEKSDDISTVTTNWNTVDSNEKIFNIKKENAKQGTYYLYVKINDSEYFYPKTEGTEEIKPIEVVKSTVNISGTTVTFGKGLSYNYKVGISDTSIEDAKNTIKTLSGITEKQDGTKTATITTGTYIYIEATDAYGNKVTYQN